MVRLWWDIGMRKWAALADGAKLLLDTVSFEVPTRTMCRRLGNPPEDAAQVPDGWLEADGVLRLSGDAGVVVQG